MSKKIALFLLVVVGLVGIVIWQTGGLSDSPEARFARAVKLMEGLQSRAIPVALSDSEIDLLEGVYQDSLVRLPNVKNFRDTDKKNLVSLLLANGFGPKTGETNGENGLNSLGEKIIMSALGRVDEFKSYLTTYFDRDVGNTPVKPEIKRLAQSINTLTNDIRLTTLFISWYENIRGTLCTTNDPENDIYISGELRFRYNNERLSLPDVCGGDNTQLKQHKCILGQYKDEESYIVRTSCPLGCRDGVCLKQNQSGLVVNFPEIVTVGKNTPIKVSVLDQNGQVDMNYTGVFFIIVGGDDEAVFPTGALNIMSGEAGRMNAVKFSKEGAMTVTVRTTTGWEVTKNVEVKKDEGNNRPYIQTDYPNKNEIFKSGDKIKIQWSTKNIALTEMVKIELGYQHHDKTYTAGTYFEELIVEKTPNNGSFVWEIPEYYSTGSVSDSFRIKVSALGIADYTDLNFSITQDTVGGNLTVTSPKQDSGYYNGDTLPIKWSKKENSSGLSLLKKSDPTFLKLFFPTGGSQGDSSWKIPTEIPQGSDYYIRVTEGASRKYTGYSGTFSIKPKTEPINNNYVVAANKLAQLNIIQPQSNVDNYKLLEPVTHQELSLILSYIFKNNISTSTSACENLTKTNKTGKMTEYETLIGALCAGGLWPEYTILTNTQVIDLAHRYGIVETPTTVNPNAEVVRGKFFVYLTKALDANKFPDICQIAPDLCPPTCPQLSPPAADFCKEGTIVDGGKNAQGCQLPPTCVASTTPVPITIACTGTLPVNSIVIVGVGANPRAWTYDSSPTGPYQNCTFKCSAGRNFVGGTCI